LIGCAAPEHSREKMSHENLYSLFGQRALDDPFSCVESLFAFVKNRNVNTVVYHTPYQLMQNTLLQPDVGGFGRFCYLPTGERLYVKIRSFFGTSECKARALAQIEYGETREISILVTTIENPLKSGTLKILVASWLTNEAPHHTTPPPPVCRVAPSQAAYGSSCAPFVLIDNFAGKRKNIVCIGGYEAIWAGSTTIIKTWDHVRTCAAETSVNRGIVNAYLAEWVAGVEKRSKVDLSVIFECSETTLKQILTKSATKVHKTLNKRQEHPDKNDAPDPCVKDFTDAVRISNSFLDQGTLAAFVDLIARDTFKGVQVSVFNAPTKFPLYMTACVLLSAFPEMARLPHTGNDNSDDKAASNVLIGMFRSLTTGLDRSSGKRTTAIEAILSVACDGTSLPAGTANKKTPEGTLKSVYALKTGMKECEEARAVPYSLEHMRRQGAALVQELFGKFPTELQNWISNSNEEFLGRDTHADALETTCDRVSKLNLAERRRLSGATGGTAMATSSTVRHSSRESMQRVVLELMIEVNTFLTDGTFKAHRFAPINSPSDEAIQGSKTGLEMNAIACRTTHADLITYFYSGVSALITDGISRVVCIRPTTSVTCGDCGDDFDPLWTLPRDNLSLCSECSVLFCHGCYLERMERLKLANGGGNTITACFMEANNDLLQCRRCTR